eukprot:GCRY01002219.1.p1 GENE.GCRY01002219.1~~GCRY01002219.1.p1  ORF type:complete len:714 (-),score=142.20 GCRY01002219.1:267-2408(-)
MSEGVLASLMSSKPGAYARQAVILKTIILALICILSFSTRLFSVLRYESVIHEFDPYFNFRSTVQLVENGIYNFHNWFDETSWYPLGRIVGGTVYPGIMWTAAFFYDFVNFFNITINIRNICVFLAPLFSSFTALATYLFTKEANGSDKQGLIAAAFVAIAPGYISRSVAGSFDNEGVAIFALIFTFYMWVKAVNTGSLFWAASCAVAYFYMVAAWGGYIFIINLIPIYVFTMLITGRFSNRLYVAYSTFYILGTFLEMQITFVGFQAVQSSEHLAAIGTFGLLQLVGFIAWVKKIFNNDQLFSQFIRTCFLIVGSVLFVGILAASATGYISPWTGRFYTLLDPTYAKEHIPIIASVSEHQPTTWSSYFFDLHLLTFLFPAGLYFCFKNLTDGNIFLVLYGMTSVYFSGVMVRLMLVFTPIACVMGGIAASNILSSHLSIVRFMKAPTKKVETSKKKRAVSGPTEGHKEIALVIVAGALVMLLLFVFHCTWVTSEAYSSPSIVLAAKQHDGSRLIFDDFREAYWWIRQNTHPEAKIMSWWDYGYQLAAMANRTVLVDNNTWNNTHIATVGKAMSGDEETAYEIMRDLDVDYVLVLFGGLTGYASDDINKFLWMVRIGGSVDPTIKEQDYFSSKGEYRVDKEASPKMLNCLMYKMCYYRFGEVYADHGRPTGFDRVRNVEIGNKDITLEHIEEAYTTEHWLVRIYKVKKPDNRA